MQHPSEAIRSFKYALRTSSRWCPGKILNTLLLFRTQNSHKIAQFQINLLPSSSRPGNEHFFLSLSGQMKAINGEEKPRKKFPLSHTHHLYTFRVHCQERVVANHPLNRAREREREEEESYRRKEVFNMFSPFVSLSLSCFTYLPRPVSSSFFFGCRRRTIEREREKRSYQYLLAGERDPTTAGCCE